VQEMERKEHWDSFFDCSKYFWVNTSDIGKDQIDSNYSLWLHNPDNFFVCFAKWLEVLNEQT